MANTIQVTKPEYIEELRTFTLFPKLPAEIRLVVWKYALAVQRISVIKPNRHWIFGTAIKPFIITHPSPAPALLHVNYESRCLAEKAYQQPAFNRLTNAPRFFNFEVDALHIRIFSGSSFWCTLIPKVVGDSTKVQHLAIYRRHDACSLFFLLPTSYLEQTLRPFKQLKTLTLVPYDFQGEQETVAASLEELWKKLRTESEVNGGPAYQKPEVTFMSHQDIVNAERRSRLLMMA
jgi:hypothetical protein